MIPVYDYRRDIANVVVRPEIRGRFMRMDPAPAGRMHSHDLGGEIFLVLEGRCRFLVEDDEVTCGPGELIYVEPRRRHTLHAVGDRPCVVYLSVTPHVEPTHTHYDQAGDVAPPRYGGWRGSNDADPAGDTPTEELAVAYARELETLGERARAETVAQERQVRALRRAVAEGDGSRAKEIVDEMWPGLREVLRQAGELELAWNALAPRVMPAAS